MGTGQFKLPRRVLLNAAGTLAAACMLPRKAFAGAGPIKIGYISPQTGPLAAFGETDNFVIAGIRQAVKDGINTAGGKRQVEIVVYDSQSSSSRAASVAADLIDKDGVSLMLVSATPETTNPVSDQCELAGVPCISTAAPWEAWYFGRGGTPDKGFDYTYHYFFGLQDAISIYSSIWNKLSTNKRVGGLFPSDADGAAWSDEAHGLPFHLPNKGFELINPGSFTSNTDNFSSHIADFKDAKVEIVTGVLNPADWNTFWKQAHQQNFRPKIATIAKALVFPAAVKTLGPIADGLTTEIVWSPYHPFKSSVTGQSAFELVNTWMRETGKPWTPPLGWTHSIFEVALDVLKRSSDPESREANVVALAETDLQTIFGNVNFKSGPFGKNICVTPTVGGQWTLSGPHGLDIEIVANDTLPAVPVTSELRPLPV
ncbi:ABC transporter substrate-binding protein [Ensifer sp. ENS06]|uniref:ABC transporter substrate-binding protein n=1 Tax=Ensifer sp. ENS06 TaxID=2769276 RepID=UPI001786B5A7|nr:ABC transporter substrate-binding protein [Ensifer sp. ENS06]MBD9627073.1 ABC transporter substrate-binding protein [Ensifer sp. ENS06]